MWQRWSWGEADTEQGVTHRVRIQKGEPDVLWVRCDEGEASGRPEAWVGVVGWGGMSRGHSTCEAWRWDTGGLWGKGRQPREAQGFAKPLGGAQ